MCQQYIYSFYINDGGYNVINQVSPNYQSLLSEPNDWRSWSNSWQS